MSGGWTHPVGVNLLFLRPGQVGGSEQYLCRQLVGLVERTHGPTAVDLGLTLFTLPAFAAAHPELAHVPAAVAPTSGTSRPVRVGVENAWLARTARIRGVRLLHHGGGTHPLSPGLRTVLTIHDVQYLTYPQYFSPSKLAFLRSAVPRAVRRADVIAVPSAFVARSLVEAFGVHADHIVVVPHGIPESELAAAPTDEAVLRATYHLPGPVVVYPAITYPHKNHQVLVRALPAIAAAGHRDLRLVLLGGKGAEERALTVLADDLGVSDMIVRPGRVSDPDRNGLYQLASALAFPSRYEGFGAPVLEAMRLGCPVLAADATALPEVLGDAGQLIDPLDAHAWADAVLALVEAPGLVAELRSRGRARATHFTAARSAAALLGAYRRALA